MADFVNTGLYKQIREKKRIFVVGAGFSPTLVGVNPPNLAANKGRFKTCPYKNPSKKPLVFVRKLGIIWVLRKR
ncbi:MAG: hypothetical protein L0Z48_04285 [candidate division Zixibacteria bacterium]|nr:hypothetical protein [candidate division Zixibacteria bacterium]MCI0595745.1 hypothetical protein [candidate division Zixibacteria bacterium]